MFRCCLLKWGFRGTVWFRKLVKLMVIGGFIECVGFVGRERIGGSFSRVF